MIGVCRDLVARADQLGGLEAVDIRHLHVEQDDGEVAASSSLSSASRPERAVTSVPPTSPSMASMAKRVLRVVVDQQNLDLAWERDMGFGNRHVARPHLMGVRPLKQEARHGQRRRDPGAVQRLPDTYM